MYKSILHYGEDLTVLKKELTAFRARITARKIREFGISDLQVTDFLDEEVYVPMEAKGL